MFELQLASVVQSVSAPPPPSHDRVAARATDDNDHAMASKASVSDQPKAARKRTKREVKPVVNG
jgi:hypothetical protein